MFWAAACSSLRPVSATDARRAQAHFELGVSLFNDGRFAEAVDHFNEARKLDPNRLDVRVQLGLGLFKLEHYEEAEKLLRDTCAARDSMPECWNNLAAVYVKEKKFKDALSASEKALADISYTTPEIALANQAEAFSFLGQHVEAVEAARKARRFSPDSCQLRVLLCSVLLRATSYEEGLQEAKIASTLCPTSGAVRLWEAYSLYKVGQRSAAERAYGEVLHQFRTGEYAEQAVRSLNMMKKRIPLNEPPL